MPEEKKDEAEDANVGEDGNAEMPEDIMPLFFTSKTQEIFGCKADEDVTEEDPCKLITKEAVLQDFKERAAVSDFHPVKKFVQVISRAGRRESWIEVCWCHCVSSSSVNSNSRGRVY